MAEIIKVMTPKFRVSYPNVFKAKKNNMSENEKMEFSLTALFKKGEDLTALQAAAKKAIEAKWGTDKTKWPANLRSPFRKQEERAKEGVLPDGYEAGAIFLNLKSSKRPGLIDGQKNDIIDETEFYAGCYARATVTAYAYEQKGNRGVSFGLQNIQKVAEGEPMSGRARATDDFEAIAGTESGSTTSNDFGL